MADAAALAELAAVTFPLACPAGTDPDGIETFIARNLSAERFAQHLAAPATGVLVYDSGAGLDGYALLIAGDEGRPEPDYGVELLPSAYVSKFYVRQAAHGGTVAGPLMAVTKTVAREVLGCASIWLATNLHNARANAFYSKHGLVRVGTRRFLVGSQLMQDVVFTCPV